MKPPSEVSSWEAGAVRLAVRGNYVQWALRLALAEYRERLLAARRRDVHLDDGGVASGGISALSGAVGALCVDEEAAVVEEVRVEPAC